MIATASFGIACSKKNAEPGSDSAAPSSTAATSTTNLGSGIPDGGHRKNINVRPERLLAGARPRLYACYQKVLAGKPTEAGDTTISIAVGADGLVKDVKFSPSALSNDTLDCMRGVVEKMQFGDDREPATFALPIAFSPPKDGGK